MHPRLRMHAQNRKLSSTWGTLTAPSRPSSARDHRPQSDFTPLPSHHDAHCTAPTDFSPATFPSFHSPPFPYSFHRFFCLQGTVSFTQAPNKSAANFSLSINISFYLLKKKIFKDYLECINDFRKTSREISNHTAKGQE